MPPKLAGGAAVGALLLCVAISLFAITVAEDPYRFFNWNVTYGDIYPLGARQRVRLNLYALFVPFVAVICMAFIFCFVAIV